MGFFVAAKRIFSSPFAAAPATSLLRDHAFLRHLCLAHLSTPPCTDLSPCLGSMRGV